jgi:hypothetical protein
MEDRVLHGLAIHKQSASKQCGWDTHCAKKIDIAKNGRNKIIHMVMHV